MHIGSLSPTFTYIFELTQWKPSCKTNSAKFAYDGICTDPEVFGHMLGLGGPPTWKMKKFSREDFEDKIGRCTASIRCVLVLLS